MQIAPICFNSSSLDPHTFHRALSQSNGYKGFCLLLSYKYSGGARFKFRPATYFTIRRLNNNRFIPGSFKIENYLTVQASKSEIFRNLSKKETSQFMEKHLPFPFGQTKSRNRKAKWQQSIAVSPSQTFRPPASFHPFLSSSTNHSMTSSHSPQLFARPGRSQ